MRSTGKTRCPIAIGRTAKPRMAVADPAKGLIVPAPLAHQALTDAAGEVRITAPTLAAVLPDARPCATPTEGPDAMICSIVTFLAHRLRFSRLAASVQRSGHCETRADTITFVRQEG